MSDRHNPTSDGNENLEEFQERKFNVRDQYSLEDIQKLLIDMDQVVSSVKAEKQGIDPKEMVKTVRGGRIVWITRGEMNAILAKQRRVSGLKYRQRALRGDNAISSEITRRIEACRTLCAAIKQVSPDDSPDMTLRMRDLEGIHNRSVSHARELRVFEEAIQRKKEEDPIYREMESAKRDMLDALNRNDLKDADVRQSYCDRHMEEYLAVQKRLEPYIKKAKACRNAFLQTKQQLYLFEFNLIADGVGLITRNFDEIAYFDRERQYSPRLNEISAEIDDRIAAARPLFLTIAELAIEELDEKKDFFREADDQYLTPLFNQCLMLVEIFQSARKSIMHSTDEEKSVKKAESSVKKKKTSRMAYQQQSDRMNNDS